MQRDYFLHHLTSHEFEDLVVSICKRWLGEGAVPFAEGRDGGRDARFKGKAELYPSTSGPWNGHIVIQAKHTKTPNASCSDSAFSKYFFDGKDSEKPKIEKLIDDKILDYYLIFTNRKLTGGADRKILKEIRAIGVKDASVIGLEAINKFLHENVEIARALPTANFSKPFDFVPDDMVEVITAVHDAIKMEGSQFAGELDFDVVNKKRVKNRVNNMSEEYYTEVVVNENMPLFDRLKSFLENERNREYRDIYHDIANELRQKIIIFRDRFEYFEEIIVYLYDVIKDKSPNLRGRRRYVTFLLCYMYFDCDIGERETVA